MKLDGAPMTIRVQVDFNTMDWDPEGRVWINTLIHADLAPRLVPGSTVVLWDTDLEVRGRVELDDSQPIRKWLARPDWSTKRDLCPP
jgi:hypothetical protein